MANVNLRRSVEYKKVEVYFFTANDKVVKETHVLHRTETGDYVASQLSQIAAGRNLSVIKYNVLERGVHLMSLPLRDYVAIAEINDGKVTLKTDKTTELTDKAE